MSIRAYKSWGLSKVCCYERQVNNVDDHVWRWQRTGFRGAADACCAVPVGVARLVELVPASTIAVDGKGCAADASEVTVAGRRAGVTWPRHARFSCAEHHRSVSSAGERVLRVIDEGHRA